MSIRNRIAAALVAGTIVFGGTPAAMAAPAVSDGYVRVRSHPAGTTIDRLHPGERVDVSTCTGRWCFVRHHGPDGWVRRRQLDFRYVSWPHPYPEPWGWGGTSGGFCLGGSGGSLCVGF